MKKKLKILILEDVEADAELIKYELKKTKITFISKRVETEKTFTKALNNFKPDIILADYNLPSFDGLSALHISQKLCPETPFIFVSGAIGEEFAIETLKQGATDYVLKNRLQRLAPAVGRALQEVEERAERKRAEKALKESEEKFRTIFENANDAIVYVNKFGKIIEVNKKVKDIFGYKRVEAIGKSFMKLNIFKLKDLPRIIKLFKESVKEGRVIDTTGKGTNIMELKIKRKNGDIAFVEASTTVLKKEGKLMGYLTILHDITERKKAEKALRESEEQFRTFAENVPGVVNIYDIYPDGRRVAIYISPGLKKLLGDATAEKIGDNVDRFFELIHPEDLKVVQKSADYTQVSGQLLDHEYRVRRIDSEEYKWVRSTGILSPMGNGVLRWQGQLYDITERKQVEERERLHTRNLAYLSKTALEFVAFPPERNIFKHITERIKEIAGDSIVVISSFDEGSRLLQCRSVVGLGKFTNRFLKLLGRDPLEICVPISEEAEQELRKGKFVKVPGGLYVFTLGQIPEKVCKAIEKLLGLGNIYAHGIAKEGTLFGSAVLLTRTKTDIKNRTVIETFISQASTALQHRLAEDELRKSEEKFRLLSENYPDVVYRFDKNHRYVYVNPAIKKSTGKPSEHYIGRILEELGYPEAECKYWRDMGQKVFDTGQPLKGIAEIKWPIGKGFISWHMVPEFGPDGKVKTVLSIERDISDIKHAEENLRKSETKYRTLVENLPQKIFLKDKNSVYISCNKNYARDFKIESDKIAGKTDYDFYPKELAEKYRAEDKRIIESGKIEDIEEQNIVDGQEVFVHTVKTPVKDDQANVIGILGIFWDITERRQLEQQLRHSQKMEAIGRLAGGIAHKFNNLLMALRGYSVLLLKQLSDSDPLCENAKKINEITSSAALLTRQLLAFSRKQTLDLTIVDPNLLIAETGKMFQPIIGEHINLVTHLDPEIEHVKVDRDQIEQVIMNLVVNARDAMTKGGTLTIETRNVTLNDEDCQSIKESKPGRFVCLLVKDTGVGMDEEVVKHIFEPFFSTKERGKGTGLGLSTVYGIIKQHEGWINVYSKLSKGTTFEIYLSAVSFKSEKSTKETVSVQNLLGRGEKILLVEDDEGICKFAAIALRKNNYVVFTASNVQTALDTFHKEKGEFDLVFCDVVLFNESGLELVDKLLSLKPKLNTLLTSGSLDKKTQRVVTGEKGFLFLEKPYHITDLLQSVKKAIDKH